LFPELKEEEKKKKEDIFTKIILVKEKVLSLLVGPDPYDPQEDLYKYYDNYRNLSNSLFICTTNVKSPKLSLKDDLKYKEV
jgi:hypothetical protein